MLKTLRARNIALLVAVVLAGQILSLALIWVLAIRPQAERVGAIMARNVAAISMTMDRLDPAARRALIGRINAGGAIRIVPGTAAPPEDRGIPTLIERLFFKAFAREMAGRDVMIWQGERSGQLWARVAMGGELWWISYERPKGWSPNGALLASFLIAITLALIGGILLQRRIGQPLRALAEAADAMRPGESLRALPIDGPQEIAAVAGSFNAMAERLRAQEAERTLMLGGISHDLRTPLAKIRLALAMAPQLDREDDALVTRQLDRMDRMLAQFLDFARGVDSEPVAETDLAALARATAIVLDVQIEIDADPHPVFATRPIALERAISNLIANAARYGLPPIAVAIAVDGAVASITVRDHGRGAHPDTIGNLDMPFVRGDAARGSDGGTGLGLAIARHVAVSLGGGLSIRNHPDGGFEARMTLVSGG